MQTGYTIEEFDFRGEPIALELDVTFAVSPYHPAMPYLPNGDPGYPAEGGEVEIERVLVRSATLDDGRPATLAELGEIRAAFDAVWETYADAIEERCLEDAADAEPDYDDADD